MLSSDSLGFDALMQKLVMIAKESPTYEKLAYYIEKNYLSLIFMTAGELAAELDISQGSVSRFFIALGYRGYTDFLKHLQKLVSEKITAPQRFEFVTGHSGKSVDGTLGVECSNMSEIPSIMKSEEYEKLVQTIVSGKDLFLLSARMSATLLPYMTYILKKMRDSVFSVTPDSITWDTLSLRDPQKTNVIAIAFPRYPKALIKKCKQLSEMGFSISAITNSQLSPIIPYCDNSITVPITVSSIFDIYSTPMAFINLTLREAAKRIPSLEDRLKLIEREEEANDVYYKNGK